MPHNNLTYYKAITSTASLVIVAMLLLIWSRETFSLEYRRVQEEMANRLSQGHEHKFTDSFKTGIEETSLPGLGRVDRCRSCHFYPAGESGMIASQGLISHPGPYLIEHDPDHFGCTICHGGQGYATTSEDAHATSSGIHWPYPLLEQPFIQSSCGQCHLSVFRFADTLAGTETFMEGHEIFSAEGCLGCHKARGVGGHVGPDLTEQGEKTRYEYNFRNIDGEQSVANWLREHFRDPEMVSPGSRMLKIDLPAAELEALATFTMGLYNPEIHFSYFKQNTLEELMGNRSLIPYNKAYFMVCSACHGKKGEGKDYEKYKTGVPALSGPGFQQILYEDYLLFTIRHGRSEREMASWLPDFSGLTTKEIGFISSHILSNTPVAPDFMSVTRTTTTSSEGARTYQVHCATCHGKEGKGGTAKAINNGGFLKSAPDQFLYKSLVYGRPEAGMPVWSHLKPEELAGLVMFIRGWETYIPSNKVELPEGAAAEGAVPYHYRCSRCHGNSGEGGTGPAIINRSFLKAADDQFLYRIISEGRDHTAMFGWESRMAGADRASLEEISNIIAYMRTTARQGTDYIEAGPTLGDPDTGRNIFLKLCKECHGANGEGIKAPALNNQEFLNAATNGFIMATITLGRPETRMPSWGYGDNKHQALTASDRSDLVAFIRQWRRFKIKRR